MSCVGDVLEWTVKSEWCWEKDAWNPDVGRWHRVVAWWEQLDLRGSYYNPPFRTFSAVTMIKLLNPSEPQGPGWHKVSAHQSLTVLSHLCLLQLVWSPLPDRIRHLFSVFSLCSGKEQKGAWLKALRSGGGAFRVSGPPSKLRTRRGGAGRANGRYPS